MTTSNKLPPLAHTLPAAPGDLAAMNRAIDKLPPQLRNAWVLRYVERLPVSEVAQRLGISVSETEARLTHALTEIRTCWQQPQCKASSTGKHSRPLGIGACIHCGATLNLRPLGLAFLVLAASCGSSGSDELADAPALATYSVGGDIDCFCVEGRSRCAVWPGRRPPHQPKGSVYVLRLHSTREIVGFSCERGGMAINIPPADPARPASRWEGARL